MASFRVRQPAEYFRILWRRRYFVLVPFLLISATLGYSVYRLPNIYESKALIIVDPPKVSSDIVKPPVSVDISARLSAIKSAAISRSSLLTLIERFDLYKNLKKQGVPTETIVQTMQDHIAVEISNMGSGYNAFTIAYQDRSPDVVQAVVHELTRQFSDENIAKTRGDAATAVTHLDNELKRVKQQLDDIIAQRTSYIVEHPSVMQGATQSIVGEMTSLSQQILATQTQIGSLQNNLANYQQMLSLVKDREDEEPLIDNDGSQTEGALRVKRAEVEANLQNLRSIYTEKHPDVKTAQLQLDKINQEMEELAKKAEDKKKRIRENRKNSGQSDNIQLQIDATKRDVARRQAELDKMNAEYAGLQAQLRSIPPLSAEMERIERDYGTLMKQHDELLTRKQQAAIGERLINDFNGETFRVQDPPNLPEAPIYPRRNFLYPLSLILGLLAGLVTAMAVEARSLFTIRDAKDVEHYTRLPLLVTVPEIITEPEAQRRRLLGLAAALTVAAGLVISVPVLVKVLEYSRLLNLITGAN